MPKNDTLMVHSVSGNTLTNARNFSYNSVQGHHHSLFGVERYADKGLLRWSMTVGCLLDPNSPAAAYNRRAVLRRPILGVGLILGEKGNSIVISDLHLPYHHKDALDFLQALDHRYRFTQVLNVGDVYDHHRGSYHESEPNSFGEEEEFFLARKAAHELQDIFPNMLISHWINWKITARNDWQKTSSNGYPA